MHTLRGENNKKVLIAQVLQIRKAKLLAPRFGVIDRCLVSARD
jgi:hypothetical protein